jgi:hypothetical protein
MRHASGRGRGAAASQGSSPYRLYVLILLGAALLFGYLYLSNTGDVRIEVAARL